jgi:putative hydrolase of the HAD superfamily
LATYELQHQPDVPVGVVISEAVDLASQFSTDDSSRFVNGVLSAISKRETTEKIEALIVDLDGVIRHWHDHDLEALAADLGLKPDELGAIAFEPELMADAMTGVLTYEEWGEEIGRRVSEGRECEAAAVAAGFAALGWAIDQDTVELLREMRAAGRAKLALFSNASTKLEADLEACDLHVEFDVVFNSARLGVAKPDPQAFLTVARMLDVPPEHCLFVDDRIPNVEGARQAGMQAEPFTGVAALRTVLERAGLLDAAAP